MLTVCPTPIGNLEDATERQVAALAGADVIACEDTRTTGKLLKLLGVPRDDGRPRLMPYHEHNEAEQVEALLDRLRGGEDVVLVSDAGTPAISDPGYRLVRAARESGIDVTVLPGPVAAVVALVGSGLPTHRWTYVGFLSGGANTRREALEELREQAATAVLYESPRRLTGLLEDIAEVFGEVEVCVARELTKLHEEWLFGPVDDVRRALSSRKRIRGEIVVVVGPGEERGPRDDVDAWLAAMLEEGSLRPSAVKQIASSATGLSKSEIWDRMERLKDSRSPG